MNIIQLITLLHQVSTVHMIFLLDLLSQSLALITAPSLLLGNFKFIQDLIFFYWKSDSLYINKSSREKDTGTYK